LLEVIAMSKRVLLSFGEGLLILGLLLATGWAYWSERTPGEAWIVETPEQIVNGATSGQELQVAFLLRNTSTSPLRILGVEAC
jgi:hypothetical protein